MKKMIDITKLIESLRKAGMEAGICAAGSSSYPLIELAGGDEIWAYIPNPDFTNDAGSLIATSVLDRLEESARTMGRVKSKKKARTSAENGKLGGRPKKTIKNE